MSRRAPPLVPTLQAVCGNRYPAPLGYGQPLPGGRVQAREVVLSKRGTRGVVVGRTTPLKPTYGQLARGRAQELCAAGYLVDVGGTLATARARTVRELNRTPRDPCPFHVAMHPQDVRAALEEGRRAQKAGEVRHARELVEDLPYPHHVAAGPCCASSANTPEGVLSVYSAKLRGEQAAALVEAARRAIPRALRASVQVERLGDVPAAMVAVQDHCLEQVEAWVDRALRPRVDKWRETKATVRAGYSWKGSRANK